MYKRRYSIRTGQEMQSFLSVFTTEQFWLELTYVGAQAPHFARIRRLTYSVTKTGNGPEFPTQRTLDQPLGMKNENGENTLKSFSCSFQGFLVNEDISYISVRVPVHRLLTAVQSCPKNLHIRHTPRYGRFLHLQYITTGHNNNMGAAGKS